MSHLDKYRPKLTGWQWSQRFALLVVGAIVLLWAWQDSDMSESSKLWSNRERAVDYIFGQPVDASTLERRMNQAERDLRTEYQAQAREVLEAEYDGRDEPRPGLMELMRRSEAIAQKAIDQIPDDQWQAMIIARVGEDVEGGRRGGYFPIETDPYRVFGDPNELDDLHPLVAWIPETAQNVSDAAGRVTRWVFVGITGNGYTGKLFETIAIAIWGTLIAVMLALPASILGADRSIKVISPTDTQAHAAGRWSVRFFIRRSFDVSRGFNEIVLAMIFVAVLGLGPLPGVLALLIHTYGVLGKVFSEAIEGIDTKPVEGVMSTGAYPSQVIALAIIPQVMPYFISQSLLRFESNVRGATILGVVGAGGIGQLLMDKFGAYEFQEVATMMVIIILVVTGIDFLCTKVMKRFT
jgi:phosphonate transport system permease protein